MKNVNAEWTDDCQGKRDYDGPVISISSRFYPGAASGKGAMCFTLEGAKLTESVIPYGDRPSAVSAVVLNIGDQDCIALKEEKFEADTDAQVFAMVEAWAEQQHDAIRAMFTAHWST